jgi:hypothetical protein
MSRGMTIRAIACSVGTGHAVLKQAAVSLSYFQMQLPVNIYYMSDKNNFLKWLEKSRLLIAFVLTT